MAHEELIQKTILKLQKATARHIGEYLHAKGLVGSVGSGDTTCRRVLDGMVFNSQLRKEGSCFMLPSLSGFGDHDKKLTESLLKLLIKYDCEIFREHSFDEVALRPDAVILAKKESKAACIILEVTNTEKPEYLRQKATTWKGWNCAASRLSSLFGIKIPFWNFVTSGRNFEGYMTLEELLKKMEEK